MTTPHDTSTVIFLDGSTACDYGACPDHATAIVAIAGIDAIEVRPLCDYHSYLISYNLDGTIVVPKYSRKETA